MSDTHSDTPTSKPEVPTGPETPAEPNENLASSDPETGSETPAGVEEQTQPPTDKDDTASDDWLPPWFQGQAPSERMHLLIGFVAPALLALFNLWRMRGFTVDDAYISYRYADNFANGLGLVYNAGERIEGYTNFSWTLILGLGIKLGFDPDVLAKALGGAFAIGSLALCYRLSATIRPLGLLPCMSTWLLATSMPFIGYAVFGLETPMFIFLVLAGTWLFVTETNAKVRGFPWSGLVFGIAGITRPEAPMYLGILMLMLAGQGLISSEWFVGKEDEGDKKRSLVVAWALMALVALFLAHLHPTIQLAKVAVWTSYLFMAVAGLALLAHLPRALFKAPNMLRGVLFLTPIAIHMAWRKSYYGSYVPNTLTAKTGDITQQITGGIDYLSRFVAHDGVVLYLALFGVGAVIAQRSRLGYGFIAIAFTGLGYVVLVGGDWMPLFRFVAPIAPFLFVLIGVGARSLIDHQSRTITYGLLMISLIVIGTRWRNFEGDRVRIYKQEKRFWDKAAGGTARWFKDQEAKRGKKAVYGTIAMGDIGEVGYKTGYPIMDLLGLVDLKVAALPGGYTRKTGKGFRDHFFKTAPRYFILISANQSCKNPSVPGSQVLYRDGRFLHNYVESGFVPLDQGFRWCIYENRRHRPDAPAPKRPTAPMFHHPGNAIHQVR